MHDLIIFGDIHTDPACYQAITELLPALFAKGYTTVYMESAPQPINEIIEEVEFDISHLEAFPDGYVPEKSKRSEKQEAVLKIYASYKNFPDQAISFARERLQRLVGDGRLEWCKARKAMLESARKLQLQVICIDVN